jgi:hypothetical protein
MDFKILYIIWLLPILSEYSVIIYMLNWPLSPGRGETPSKGEGWGEVNFTGEKY